MILSAAHYRSAVDEIANLSNLPIAIGTTDQWIATKMMEATGGPKALAHPLIHFAHLALSAAGRAAPAEREKWLNIAVAIVDRTSDPVLAFVVAAEQGNPPKRSPKGGRPAMPEIRDVQAMGLAVIADTLADLAGLGIMDARQRIADAHGVSVDTVRRGSLEVSGPRLMLEGMTARTDALRAIVQGMLKRD